MIFNATSGVPIRTIRGMMAPNLLDNSDFRRPVAQAGVGGRHGTVSYAVDRWILSSGTVSLEEGVGLTLNGTIRQRLEFPPAGTVSAFVGMASGEASISYENGEVTVTSAGGVLEWAALYEGAYTAATMPPYVPKGYGGELVACMRYFQKIDSVTAPWLANWTIVPGRAFPVPMRVNPTVTLYDLSGNAGYVSAWGENGKYKASAQGTFPDRFVRVVTEIAPSADTMVDYAADVSADL